MHIINRLLGLVGLRLSREARQIDQRVARQEIVELKIGHTVLRVPTQSALYDVYRRYPNYMSELGRVASIVWAKYPSALFVDIGANIGDTAAIVRAACKAPILCVEGDPLHKEILQENARRIGDIHLKFLYLSDKEESLSVLIEKEGSNSTVIPSNEDLSRSVDFTTLDKLLDEFEGRQVKLLKIDTEGFDPKILRGSSGLLRKDRPVVVFEHNRENLMRVGEDNLSSFHQLKDAGYQQVLVWDAYGRLLLGTDLQDDGILQDLHGYVRFENGHLGKVLYLDVCAFHKLDSDLALACLEQERGLRERSLC
jgi:FkbM family methyltransferase